MITCPNCGELNGDNLQQCFKCKTDLKSGVPSYKKICTKCKKLYDAKAETCEKCHRVLSVYNPDIYPDMKAPDSSRWAYLLAALLPGIGLVAGIVLLVLKHEEGGAMIAVSILASVLWGLLGGLLSGAFLY